MFNPQFAEEMLQYHNTLRALHNSPDLVIDIKLNDFAQEWADIIATKDCLKHRQENDCGENIYVCRSEDSDCDVEPGVPVQIWYDENSEYVFGEPSPADICAVGHFTQLVWRNSKRLGVGIATSETGKVYVVCNYQPAGNIAGEFAKNVFPKDDGADAVPDQSDIGSIYTMHGKLKTIPEAELRVWLAWLTKVADVALDEWQPLLNAHTQLAARINAELLKARREVELEKKRRAEQCEKDNIQAVHDLDADPETLDAAAATRDDVDKGADDDKDAVDTEKAASIGIVPTDDDDNALKRIPMPRDAEEMLRIVRQFRREAKKYRTLYGQWQAQADRVMEEIGEKPTAEQVYTHGEIPSFPYLRDEADVDTKIDEDGCNSDDEDDEDDDEDVEMPSGPLERITYRGELHLFFNLTGERDAIEQEEEEEDDEDEEEEEEDDEDEEEEEGEAIYDDLAED